MIIFKKIILPMLLASYMCSVKSKTDIFVPVYLDTNYISGEIEELKEQSKIITLISAAKEGCFSLVKALLMAAPEPQRDDFIMAKDLSGAQILHMAENRK